jgi:tetratricopeptide (TPR) repeat protein
VDALAEYQKARQISGEPLAYAGDVGRVYALIGRKAEAQTILQQLRDTSKKHSDVSDYSRCLIYASLGDPERAFTWLRKSIEDREFTATELRHDRRIDDLRADLASPRFAVRSTSRILDHGRTENPPQAGSTNQGSAQFQTASVALVSGRRRHDLIDGGWTAR